MAINVSKKGKIPVLAYPTKKLMYQSKDESNSKISLLTFTSEKRYKYKEMYNIFESPDASIYLTLHSYFRFMGDCPDIAMYAKFLLHYRKKVWCVIDEVYLFVQRSLKIIPSQRVRAARFENHTQMPSSAEGITTSQGF